MKRIKVNYILLAVFVLIALVFSSCVRLTPSDNEALKTREVWSQIDNAPYIEGRLIVGYTDYESLEILAMAIGAEITVNIERIQAAGLKFSGTIETAREKIKDLFEEDLELLESFRYIEPSYDRYLIEPLKDDSLKLVDLPSVLADNGIPNLEQFLWGIKKVKAPEAWAAGYDGTGVTVAVFDTGIDSTHPDLQGQVTLRYDPVLGLEIDPDIDYTFGAHGTHVAGTIAAKDDGQGVVGVAPGASLMDIPIFQPGYIGDEFVAAGIVYAVENGATVLSNSWGGKGYSSVLKDAIDYANFNNVVFVNSAGNSHTDEIGTPKMYPGVVVVAASTAVDGITYFSTRGLKVSVAAPGDYTILSTVPLWDVAEFAYPDLPYAYYGGTSMACPHVSGAIAILQQKHAGMELTAYQYRRLIELGADDIMAPGKDIDSGYGRLNIVKSLAINPSIIGQGGNVMISTQTARSKYDEEFGWYDPVFIPGVYVTLIPKDPKMAPLYVKSTGDLSGAGAILFDIDPGYYDVYFGNGDLWAEDSLLAMISGRTQEQVGFAWKNYEVGHSLKDFSWVDVAEFSSSPKVVVQDVKIFEEDVELKNSEIAAFVHFDLIAFNAMTFDEFSTTIPYSGGTFTLPNSAPGPLYAFFLEPYSEDVDEFLMTRDAVFVGYVEYDNNPSRRIPFKVKMAAGTGSVLITDSWSPYFSAF